MLVQNNGEHHDILVLLRTCIYSNQPFFNNLKLLCSVGKNSNFNILICGVHYKEQKLQTKLYACL